MPSESRETLEFSESFQPSQALPLSPTALPTRASEVFIPTRKAIGS